jgi:hypothetical protein
VSAASGLLVIHQSRAAKVAPYKVLCTDSTRLTATADANLEDIKGFQRIYGQMTSCSTSMQIHAREMNVSTSIRMRSTARPQLRIFERHTRSRLDTRASTRNEPTRFNLVNSPTHHTQRRTSTHNTQAPPHVLSKQLKYFLPVRCRPRTTATGT